ncbi:MAG: cyclic nucleotide-binding domain-containing protein [Dehalococcoidia bacterium]|nr:cyclic nucleotide-binding domain-containing protein [Dehalococcoidia bacterium]
MFEPLAETDLEKIAAFTESRQYEAGATIFTQGTPARELIVLAKGKVALQMQLPTSKDNLVKRVTVDIAAKNDLIGWSAAVGERLYSLTAICLEQTTVAAIDGLKLKALMQQDARTGYHVLSRLIEVAASRLDETRQVLVSERLSTVQS